jgi:hypothetical protein
VYDATLDSARLSTSRRLYDYDFDDDGAGGTAPAYFTGEDTAEEDTDNFASANSTAVSGMKCSAQLPFSPMAWPVEVSRASLGQRTILSLGAGALVVFLRLLVAIYTGAVWCLRTEDGADIATSCLELSLWLCCAYMGEHMMPYAPRTESADMFFAVCLIAVLVSVCRIKVVRGAAVPLNRDQTNEWRGWMQIAFCMFHYANYDPAYVPIRAFVACYVWQTGWGNTLYFLAKKDYSFRRFSEMLWRINFFAMLLSMVTSTDWILYYVVALHTLHFAMLFLFGLCGGLSEGRCCCINTSIFEGRFCSINTSKLVVVAKLAIFLGIIAVVWSDSMYTAIDEPLRVTLGKFFANTFAYRTYLDRFSSWPGVVAGFFWAELLVIFGFGRARPPGGERGDALDDQRSINHGRTDYAVSRAVLVAASVLLMAVSLGVYAVTWNKPVIYRDFHPYTGTVWIFGYILVRNAHPMLRAHVMAPMEWIGKHSLEIYLLQFHLLMTKQAGAVLVVIPDAPFTNACVVWPFFILAAWRVFTVTQELRSAFFNSSTAARLAVLFIFIGMLLLNALASMIVDENESSLLSIAVALGILSGVFVCVLISGRNQGHKACRIPSSEERATESSTPSTTNGPAERSTPSTTNGPAELNELIARIGSQRSQLEGANQLEGAKQDSSQAVAEPLQEGTQQAPPRAQAKSRDTCVPAEFTGRHKAVCLMSVVVPIAMAILASHGRKIGLEASQRAQVSAAEVSAPTRLPTPAPAPFVVASSMALYGVSAETFLASPGYATAFKSTTAALCNATAASVEILSVGALASRRRLSGPVGCTIDYQLDLFDATEATFASTLIMSMKNTTVASNFASVFKTELLASSLNVSQTIAFTVVADPVKTVNIPTGAPTASPTAAPSARPTIVSCHDSLMNSNGGTETDIDCGGESCPACAPGKTCLVDSDCQSGSCLAGKTCDTMSPTASPTMLPTTAPTHGRLHALPFDESSIRAQAQALLNSLDTYYGGKQVLKESMYLKAGDSRYEEGLDFIATKMARALLHSDKFVIGTIGSSVTAGHDNCNYDSYQRQLHRTMAPLWEAAGVNLEVRNAGQGGGCGDDFMNQPFCIRHMVGDDADIIHYSWTYFEAGNSAEAREMKEALMRWALLMEHSPALQVINAGEISTSSQCRDAFGPEQFFNDYGKFGMNAICLQLGLKSNGWPGNTWGAVGDTMHTTTRYVSYIAHDILMLLIFLLLCAGATDMARLRVSAKHVKIV